MQIDPWSSEEHSDNRNGSDFFEDNFVGGADSESLPDSAAYVTGLENRLARLKKSGPRAEKDILDSLSKTREDCLVRLLTESTSLSEEGVADNQDIPTKWLKSHINPQQPLTVLELVELVKADYLAKQSEDDSQEN